MTTFRTAGSSQCRLRKKKKKVHQDLPNKPSLHKYKVNVAMATDCVFGVQLTCVTLKSQSQPVTPYQATRYTRRWHVPLEAVTVSTNP